ncbi:unnamed protein product [Rhizophagus irregularis]|nr:unnamed protein product [Rhizophagus irregularis]
MASLISLAISKHHTMTAVWEINVNSLVARINLIAVSVISVVFEHFVLLVVVDAYTYVKVYLAHKEMIGRRFLYVVL